MSHFIKPDSIDSYVSGICNQLEPFFPDICLHCKAPLVKCTMTGCKRMYGSPWRHQRALTTVDLETVLAYYPTPSHDDLLFCTLLLTGFFALMRLGKLTDADSLKLYDPCKTIHHSSVESSKMSYSLFLSGHKGDRFFDGNTIIIPKNDKSYDPHSCFLQYLSSCDQKFPLLSPLWLRDDGGIPTRSWFTCRLRHFFNSSVSGHSMRAGGVTLLAELGTLPHLIQAIGRWKSDAFEAYIRKHPVLIQALLFGHSV